MNHPRTGSKVSGLWVMDADGSDMHRLRETRGHLSFAWSPDGKQVASVEGGDPGPSRMVAATIDGSEERVLSEALAAESPGAYPGVLDITWSSDGSKILIDVMRDEDNRQVWDHYSVNADGSGETLVLAGVDASELAVSPDGTNLAFMGQDQQIYVMNVDGSGRMRLTEPPSRNFTPAWSPDGTRIVFSGDPGLSTRLPSTRVEIMNADGSGRRVVTQKGDRYFSEPAWSPDGQWIAFDNWPHEDWGWVTLVHPDGSDRHNVTPELRPPTQHAVSWSPDSQRLAFVEGDGIAVVAPNGSHRTCLSGVGRNNAPVWSPDGSKIAFFRY